MSIGYLSLVLHAHLPFVRHPEYPEFLEEDWLFEAISETYIPLIQMQERLLEDGVHYRMTMSLTPPLCEMLADPLLQERYLRHIENLLELIDREVHRTRTETPQYHDAARMYQTHFQNCRSIFRKYDGNLTKAFRAFQDQGSLEIVTCTATHGFLPLMHNENAKRAQVQVARNNYRKHFGRDPRGIWLAECGYKPGADVHLHEAGIRHFFVDSHGIMYGHPRPRCGVFAPVYCPSGVAAFGRDVESSKQVWSSQEGYPGDFRYREFYRDIGYDAPFEYIQPHLHADGLRRNLGIKYCRITGDVELGEKDPYDPKAARELTVDHAANFMFNRPHQARFLNTFLGRKPIIVSPYDAELFGHWWFEGPWFLEHLIRKIHHDQDEIELINPTEYLQRHPVCQKVTPTMSSWGDKGYAEVWLNATNDWIYRHLHNAEDRMIELAQRLPNAEGLKRRALNQAARELLLAQSSDWAFIMTTGTMVSYAEKRTRNHIANFNELYWQLQENRVDEGFLAHIEYHNNIFSEVDYSVYA